MASTFLSNLHPTYHALLWGGIVLFVVGIIVLILWLTGVIAGDSTVAVITPTPTPCEEEFALLGTQWTGAQVGSSGSFALFGQSLSADGAFLTIQGVGTSAGLGTGDANVVLVPRTADGEYTTVAETVTVPDGTGASGNLRYDGLQYALPRAQASPRGNVLLYHRATVDDALFGTPITLTPPTTTGVGFGKAATFTTNDPDHHLFIEENDKGPAPDDYGVLHIYKNVTTIPVLVQTLEPPSPLSGDAFGFRNFVQSNQWLVTTAPSAGMGYAYERSTTTGLWTLSGGAFESVEMKDTRGSDIWISPDGLMVVMGQAEYPIATPGALRGRVEIFTRATTADTFASARTFTEPGGEVDRSAFGTSTVVDPENQFLAISGHALVPDESAKFYVYALDATAHTVGADPVATFEYGDFVPSPGLGLGGNRINFAQVGTLGQYVLAATLVDAAMTGTNVSTSRVFQGCLSK